MVHSSSSKRERAAPEKRPVPASSFSCALLCGSPGKLSERSLQLLRHKYALDISFGNKKKLQETRSSAAGPACDAKDGLRSDFSCIQEWGRFKAAPCTSALPLLT